MSFKKGQSGNPGGRPKRKEFTERLRYHLLCAADSKFELAKEYKRIDVIAMSLVQNAMKGEGWAIKEVADRIEGKCPQPVVGDDDYDPIELRVSDESSARMGRLLSQIAEAKSNSGGEKA